MKKKILFSVFLVALFFVPFFARADELTAETFAELKELNTANTHVTYTGATLDLTEDFELVAFLDIKANTTLNLNGHTLSISGHGTQAYPVTVFGNSSLTINGAGNVQIADIYGFATAGSGSPKITVNGGTFTQTGDYYMFGVYDGELIINDGTFTTPYCVANNFGGYYRIQGGQYSDIHGKITINGGTFTTTDDYDMTFATSDVLVINGGTFNSQGEEGTTVYTEAPGETTINDGTFNASGTNSEVLYNDQGTVTVNAGNFNNPVTAYIPNSSITYTNTTGVNIVVPKDELVIKAFDEPTDPTEEETTKVNAALEEGFVVGKYYNITAWLTNPDDNTKIEQVEDLENAINVTLTIPADLPELQEGYTRIFKVIRIHNGEATVLSVVDNGNGTITFQTDVFSTYVLTYADQAPAADPAEDNTNNPNTADKIILYFSALVISAAAVTITALYINRVY